MVWSKLTLPKVFTSRIRDSRIICSASFIKQYDRLRRLEGTLKTSTPTSTSAVDALGLRVLGHLMREANSYSSLRRMSKAITSTPRRNEMNDLTALGRVYIRDFVNLFFNPPNWRVDTVMQVLQLPIDSKRHEKYVSMMKDGILPHTYSRYLALERDHYRCSITGSYDYCYNEIERYIFEGVTGRSSTPTFEANIIPARLIKAGAAEVNKKTRETCVKSILKDLGYEHVVDTSNDRWIHDLRNVLTMGQIPYHHFNSLRMWLEATGIPNEYLMEKTSIEASMQLLSERRMIFQRRVLDFSSCMRCAAELHTYLERMNI
ncbi:hypothetical protein AX16_006039 [Volvariella volvacea WC 439]|nr:hypothetical protein AX16_006039 [Volvariella volvacea WC 439]